MNRYSRHISLKEIGQAGQNKIDTAKVLVVGAGGLGCPVLQYLAAAGIGTIGVVDFDTVDESNLQRQILFRTSTIGKNKALIAKQALASLNPTITINTYTKKITSENIVTIVEPYDIVVDATDNFVSRYLINDATIVLGKPLVYAAIYKFEGHVAVFNYQNGPSYRCLFPNLPQENSLPNCSEVGVLGVLPGIIGTMQANEVLKIVLGIGESLSGKLFCYNALTNYTRIIRIRPNEVEKQKVKDRGVAFEVLDNSLFCTTHISTITIDNIVSDDVQYIDVRELSEQPRIHLKNLIEIPLGELSNRLEEISKNKKVIVFCQSGVRSKQAVLVLQKHNILNSYSLEAGVSAFSKTISKTP